MDREMKRHYTLLVDFLGKILGPDYEVALHELLDDSNEIIAIANGELTGRHLGSPLSNKMLEFLTSRLYETQDYVLRFESTSVTGKKLCSNSLFIKDPHGRLVGLLCINFDSSRYRELSARVMDLCGSLLTPGAPSGTHLIVENDEHTYPSSIAGATASIVSSVIADYPVPVDRLTQDEKMEIMDALNRKGAKVGGAAQTIFTVAKLIPLVLIMIFGFIRGNGNPIFDPMLGEGLKFGSVLGQLMIAVLFAYEGWTNVGAIAGEMKDPGRDLPKAIVGGVALIMAVYIIINLAYLWVLPADVMMNLESPASAVGMQIFGNMGGKIVSVGIMISAGGACNGFILSGSRTALYMAEQGDLPGSKAMSKISGTGVPINCIFLIGILGAIYALTGQFDLLTNLGTFVGWVFYTLTFLAVMAYRKQAPDLKRTYKVPAYPVIPIIAIISGLYVLLNQLFMAGPDARKVAVGGIILVLIGLPVRAIFTKKKAA